MGASLFRGRGGATPCRQLGITYRRPGWHHGWHRGWHLGWHHEWPTAPPVNLPTWDSGGPKASENSACAVV